MRKTSGVLLLPLRTKCIWERGQALIWENFSQSIRLIQNFTRRESAFSGGWRWEEVIKTTQRGNAAKGWEIWQCHGVLQPDLCRIRMLVLSSSELSLINRISSSFFLGYSEIEKTNFPTIISLMQSFFYYKFFHWPQTPFVHSHRKGELPCSGPVLCPQLAGSPSPRWEDTGICLSLQTGLCNCFLQQPCSTLHTTTVPFLLQQNTYLLLGCSCTLSWSLPQRFRKHCQSPLHQPLDSGQALHGRGTRSAFQPPQQLFYSSVIKDSISNRITTSLASPCTMINVITRAE